MLTTVDDIVSAVEAMPDGALDAARRDHRPQQFELLDPDTSTFANYVEEDPIVHRRRIHDDKWIRRIGEEDLLIAPYWSWQKYISDLVDALPWGVAKQVRDILKKASRKVAVNVAQGQPPHHQFSNYRPKSCQVHRFGRQARGPPGSAGWNKPRHQTKDKYTYARSIRLP